MKQFLHLIIILTLCFSCKNTTGKKEQNNSITNEMDYWRHLSYLIQIKNVVAERQWDEFSKKDFFQPLIYYTFDGTFAINPNQHILKITQHEKSKPFDDIEVIKLSEIYTDTTNFNFNISYTDSDSSALYYQENVLFFQSFDLTKKLIGVTDLQDWSIMVIHELFHGYQRKIPQFKAHYTQLEIPGGPDEYLGRYHKELEWYRESVYKENELLKSIWINDAAVVDNLRKYDSLRTLRIDRIMDEHGINIREVEDYEILIEGHARYFESLCKRHLAKSKPSTAMLSKEDFNFISNMYEGYSVKKDKGLYDIYNDRYYYQLGYNISMILEKFLPNYKETIYTENNSFNPYLKELKAHNIDSK